MKKTLQYFSKNKNILIFLIILILLFGFLFLIFPQLLFDILCILNIYSDVLLAIIALLGLIFGQSWLDTSKKKMKGKLDYDIARKYLKMVLQLRDAIKIVRNPFITIGEMQVALEKKGYNVNDYEDKEKLNRSVYSMRWEKIQESWTNFDEILIEAEVSWGNEVIDIQKDLDLLIRNLRSVVWLFVNNPQAFNNKKEENDKILYGTHDENDEFAKKVNTEIDKIRIFLKKYL